MSRTICCMYGWCTMIKIRTVIAIISGFFCSILLSGLSASYIIPHLHIPILLQFPVIILVGLPGPFFAGIISKKHGWIIGSTTIILYEILLAIFMIFAVRGTSTPSSSMRLTDYHVVYSTVQVLLCSGLAVFLGALAGHLGEQAQRRLFERDVKRKQR